MRVSLCSYVEAIEVMLEFVVQIFIVEFEYVYFQHVAQCQ